MTRPAYSGAASPAGALALSDFDFELPPERIATHPAQPRDASRLLVLSRVDGLVAHRRFRDLPELLAPGDLLVVNEVRVIPARVAARRASGGGLELLFVAPLEGALASATRWSALARPGKALKVGAVVHLPDGSTAHVVGKDGGQVILERAVPLWRLLESHGEVPLPPYLGREAGPADAEDYQTLFAREPGAVAAPTAALHFTKEVLRALTARGVELATLVLHVGPGTFQPVRPECADDVRRHVMAEERYRIPDATLAAVGAAHKAGRRVVAVGTTATRALEGWARSGAAEGATDLFILPGFEFQVVDALLTNFHLPRSTLLMLVSAFAGGARVRHAYDEAIREGYRFYSYGDAMLIT